MLRASFVKSRNGFEASMDSKSLSTAIEVGSIGICAICDPNQYRLLPDELLILPSDFDGAFSFEGREYVLNIVRSIKVRVPIWTYLELLLYCPDDFNLSNFEGVELTNLTNPVEMGRRMDAINLWVTEWVTRWAGERHAPLNII